MAPALKTILIVDDDEGMRDTLTAILKRDYRVLSVSSAEDGLSRLRQTRVDLMLLDVRLPGIGGLELLRQVREQRDEVEVIMISRDHRRRTRRPGDEAWRLPLHHEGIRLRRPARRWCAMRANDRTCATRSSR